MPRSSKHPQRVTLADVARYASVSTAVVSYVVNDGPRPVAADTAVRVRNAIAVLGYRPNTPARASSTGSTGILGVIHPGTANPFFGEYNDVIFDTATKAGVALLTATSAGNPDQHQLIQALAGRNVDGIIAMTSMTKSDVSRLRPSGVPVLFVNCPFPVPGYRTIGPDAFDGAQRLVDHLLTDHHDRASPWSWGTPGPGSRRTASWAGDTRTGCAARHPVLSRTPTSPPTAGSTRPDDS